MCGIFCAILNEVSSVEQDKMVKVFKQGLAVTSLRGTDSTGVAAIKAKSGLEIYKKALPSWDFLEMKKTDELLDSLFSDKIEALIGHCRAKTVGHATTKNAHPFTRGHITLVHNGTLTRHQTLTKTDYTVDSDAIACAISESTDTVQILESIEGAFALVWYNEEVGTVSLARNKERPLAMAITKSGSIFVASELKLLEWLLYRNSIEYGLVKEIPVGLLLTIKLEDFSSTSKEFTPKEPVLYDYRGEYAFYAKHKSPNTLPAKAAQSSTSWNELVKVESIMSTHNHRFCIVSTPEGEQMVVKIAFTSLNIVADDVILVFKDGVKKIKLNGSQFQLASFIRRATEHEKATYEWDMALLEDSQTCQIMI